MNNIINEISFKSKECKNISHNLCVGQWKGFGFQIVCNCICHRKQLLGIDEALPNTVDLLSSKNEDYDYHS